MHQNRHPNYRFGDFEVRLESQTLLHKGVPVAIQKLPFLMLTVLLENPSQIITRETLQKRLWGEQGYLQFDNGIHVAAAKLREALSDDASAPRFIRNIPRRGYQFIADDLVVLDSSEDVFLSKKDLNEAPESAANSSSEVRGTSSRQLSPSVRHREWLLSLSKTQGIRVTAISVLSFCVILLAATLAYRETHDPRITNGETVMFGSFTNKTGDAELDEVYDFPFHVDMRKSRYLHIEEKVGQDGVSSSTISTSIPDLLSQCRNSKVDFLLTGLLERQGEGYDVRLSSWSCTKSRLLTTESAYAGDITLILSALDEASMNLRRALGEPKESFDHLDPPSTQALTGSLAALRAFHLGESKRTPATADQAISFYKLATDLDPQFALAYDRLGITYTWTGQTSLSKRALTTAFRLRDRTTDRERLSITAHYYTVVSGELPLAVQTYRLWISMFPYDNDPLNTLSSIYLDSTAEPAMALELERKAIAINPESVPGNVNLAQAHLELGDFNYFHEHCQNLSLPGSKTGSMRIFCYLADFSHGDEAGMQRELDRPQTPLNIGRLLSNSAMVAVYRGEIEKSTNLFLQSRKELLVSHNPELSAEVELQQAFLESSIGMKASAREDAIEATKLDSASPMTLGMAALVLANIGNSLEAKDMESKASLLAPLDTQLNIEVLGTAHTLLNLNTHNSQDAIQSTNGDRSYDFNIITLLAPAYYRGITLENQHDWSAAASQFQSIIDHRNILPCSLFVALAELELGHALKENGDEEHAAAIFHDLDHLWAHADPLFEPKQRLNLYEHVHRTTL